MGARRIIMTDRDKKRIAEFEADLKKMQKDHKKTFEVFEEKKKPSGIRGFLAGLFTQKK
ncbi:MAG: hypothetical protein ACI4KF_09220 [Huintestinicola sp.]